MVFTYSPKIMVLFIICIASYKRKEKVERCKIVHDCVYTSWLRFAWSLLYLFDLLQFTTKERNNLQSKKISQPYSHWEREREREKSTSTFTVTEHWNHLLYHHRPNYPPITCHLWILLHRERRLQDEPSPFANHPSLVDVDVYIYISF